MTVKQLEFSQVASVMMLLNVAACSSTDGATDLVSTGGSTSMGAQPGTVGTGGEPSAGTGGAGTGGLGSASGGAGTGTGGALTSSQFYFNAGAWKGYGWTDAGPAGGGIVSELTGEFSTGTKAACVSGTLAEDFGSLGILGMAVNQQEGSDTLGEWTPGDYKGVAISVTRNLATGLRLELGTADGTTYCTELTTNTATLSWTSFRTECWGTAGVAYDPSQGITQVQLYAPGDESSVVQFDYCLDKLEPVEDAGPVFDPSHKFVGNITTYGEVRSDFADYWDQITPENEGKWGSVEGTRDQYNWAGVDAAYDYAKSHGFPFKQHTFVWGSQYPAWIDSLAPAEQAAEIEEWIHDFCVRYPDTALIDVVNEATPGHAPANYAKSAFGDDWIIKTFQLARQHCPNAILILNDYNVLTWNTDEFIQMATPAVNAGVIDAIGLQAHGFEGWALADLQKNFNKVLALGLPIYISEYDVARTNDQEQLQIMKTQFTYFYEHPSVKGLTLWGYVVGRTWVNGSGLIQDNGTPRPAMTWLMDYLGR